MERISCNFTNYPINRLQVIITDTTQIQPYRIFNIQRTENKTTDVVIQRQSRKLLMMDILMSDTCWAHKKWNKIASDIKLVFYSSTSLLHVSDKTPIYRFLHKKTVFRWFMLWFVPACSDALVCVIRFTSSVLTVLRSDEWSSTFRFPYQTLVCSSLD